MIDLDEIKIDLKANGWCRFELGEISEANLGNELRKYAQKLGSIIYGRHRKEVERLIPLGEKAAYPSSLSIKYGLADFPFHNDAAHLPIPARYLLLACANPGQEEVATWVLDSRRIKLTDDQLNSVKRGIFFVRTGRRSFYTSMSSSWRNFLRFDPGCMEPMDEDAVNAAKIFLPERVTQHAQKIEWEIGTVVVIDNWRTLHRREAIVSEDSDRVLLRCSVA